MRWLLCSVLLFAAGCGSDKTNCGALCGDVPSDGAVDGDGSIIEDADIPSDGAVGADGAVASDAGDVGDTGIQRGFDAEPGDALEPFDGGDVMPSNAACQSVLFCCSMVPRDQQPPCYQTADDDEPRVCQRLLTSYQQRGWCTLPDAGPPDTGPDAGVTSCQALSDCCASRGRNQPRGCASVVAAGDEQRCEDLFVQAEC